MSKNTDSKITTDSLSSSSARKIRRVVTGHNQQGKSIVIQDEHVPFVGEVGHPRFLLTDIWRSGPLPADNESFTERCSLPLELEPERAGNLLRYVEFPPDALYLSDVDFGEAFNKLGGSGAESFTGESESPHPMMHRSNTVDYIIILSGEIYAVLDAGEVRLGPGDVLIQRGTNHAWSNRSNDICRALAILNSAHPLANLE